MYVAQDPVVTLRVKLHGTSFSDWSEGRLLL